jgi:hypothetical protein
VLERTQLAPVGRPESGVRKGVTIVPRRGVRVRQVTAPQPATAERPERVSQPVG